MPKYMLGKSIRAEIEGKTYILLDAYVLHQLSDFPLSAAQIERATVPADELEMLRALRARGCDIFMNTSRISVLVDPQDIPNLSRKVVLSVRLPLSIIYARRASLSHPSSTTIDSKEEGSCVRLDATTLDAATASKLAAWCARAVRAVRLAEMVRKTVAQVLNVACSDTASVHANWPFLATLAQTTFWVERFRNPPRDLTRYKADEGFFAAFAKRMEASEVVLNTALLLGPYTPPSNCTVSVSVIAWEHQKNDPSWC